MIDYLDDVTQGVQHLAYDDADVRLEQGRIINEMKQALGNRNDLRHFAFKSQVYAGQPHSQWLGGYPDHLAQIKLSDIRDYHAATHTTANMALITSGDWSHEQACTWANWHLDILPRGQRYPTPRSVLTPSDVRYHDPSPSASKDNPQIDYNVIFDNSQPKTVDQWAALTLGQRIISEKLGQDFAKQNAIYSMRFALDNLVDHTTEVCVLDGSSLPAQHMRPLLSGAVKMIGEICATMTREDFQLAQQLMVKRAHVTRAFTACNVQSRASWMLGDYLKYNNPSRFMTLRAAIETVTYEQTVQAVRDLFMQPISTFLWGDVEGRDFPTGAELSDILCRGLGASSAPSTPQPGPSPR